MKSFIQFLKDHSKIVKYFLVILFFLFALIMTIFSVNCFIQYSSFTIGMVKATIGILILLLIDDVIFRKIDTIQAINDKNISYALIYLGNAIIVAACIGFA